VGDCGYLRRIRSSTEDGCPGSDRTKTGIYRLVISAEPARPRPPVLLMYAKVSPASAAVNGSKLFPVPFGYFTILHMARTVESNGTEWAPESDLYSPGPGILLV
jgi:hypothetical protein